ncbi:MAG: hypothetical protein ACSI46_25125 [Gloeotrichia echinulata DVL01]
MKRVRPASVYDTLHVACFSVGVCGLFLYPAKFVWWTPLVYFFGSL